MEAPEESPAAPLDSVGWRIVGGLVVGGWDVRFNSKLLLNGVYYEFYITFLSNSNFF